MRGSRSCKKSLIASVKENTVRATRTFSLADNRITLSGGFQRPHLPFAYLASDQSGT